jgi:hypothetical protein
MTPLSSVPAEFIPVREAVLRALSPIKAADSSTGIGPQAMFYAKRTNAGRELPAYYLVYFLLVDLLGFKNMGQWEKVSWSVPIDFNGQRFVIEHRKLGLGVFANPERDEEAAHQIVSRIAKAVKIARPFFDWLADQAMDSSAINIRNNSNELFHRYAYLHALYQSKADEAERRKDERIVQEEVFEGGSSRSVTFPSYKIQIESGWLAHSAIEAFFSWTEHVFIHLAILTKSLASARYIAELARSDWPDKFKAALDVADPRTKGFYDRLLTMRLELRNYVAHGAFGKQGQAFTFHSGAGAVPVLLPHRRGKFQFSFGEGLAFDAVSALQVLEEFTTFLWEGHRAPAKIYIESELPVILTKVADGSYADAMRSPESMEEFTNYLTHSFDQAANMDW